MVIQIHPQTENYNGNAPTGQGHVMMREKDVQKLYLWTISENIN